MLHLKQLRPPWVSREALQPHAPLPSPHCPVRTCTQARRCTPPPWLALPARRVVSPPPQQEAAVRPPESSRHWRALRSRAGVPSVPLGCPVPLARRQQLPGHGARCCSCCPLPCVNPAAGAGMLPQRRLAPAPVRLPPWRAELDGGAAAPRLAALQRQAQGELCMPASCSPELQSLQAIVCVSG